PGSPSCRDSSSSCACWPSGAASWGSSRRGCARGARPDRSPLPFPERRSPRPADGAAAPRQPGSVNPTHPFETGLDRNAANYAPRTPVSFLQRSAEVYPGKVAVVHGEARHTYAQFLGRVRRLASVLARSGIARGDTVAIMAPNVPAMLEAHYAVPGIGAVL